MEWVWWSLGPVGGLLFLAAAVELIIKNRYRRFPDWFVPSLLIFMGGGLIYLSFSNMPS